MEMHERIKKLRKEYLKLSQEAFGERLGVSRSVINNIERNCLARPDQKLSLIKLMCKDFGVNEEWLLYGNEPMFSTSETFSLEEFAKEREMSDLELEILKTYFEIDPQIRTQFLEQFLEKFGVTTRRSIFDGVPDTSEELERQFPPVDIHKKTAG